MDVITFRFLIGLVVSETLDMRLMDVVAAYCCVVAVAQINYPTLKLIKQDSIEQARGRSQEDDLVQIVVLYVMQLGGLEVV